MNQCDGCRQQAPIRGNRHVDENDRAFMVCQAYKYVKEETIEERAKRELSFPIEGSE
jgi:hypothetical protein